MAQHFGINLVKGQNVELNGLSKIIVGCGWDPQHNQKFDLDVACAMLDVNGKMLKSDHFIYYGRLVNMNNSIIHTGDNLTGEGDGDDERIIIDLHQLPSWVDKIPIVVCIYDAQNRRQNFGMIRNSYVRIIDVSREPDTTFHGPFYNSVSYPNQQFCKYELGENSSTCDGFIFGELYKHNGAWKYRAVEQPLTGGFNQVLHYFV